MKEIVFHVGSHKTGTTTVQYSLHQAQEQGQLAELGLYYPQAGRIGRNGHHNLVYEIASRTRYRENLGGWDALQQELQDRPEDRIMLSSESLSGYRNSVDLPEKCYALAKALGRRPRVVAYLRPQSAYLESIYAQNAATGYTSLRFERYLLESIAQNAADYGAVLKNWETRFGSCEVFPFQPQPGSTFLEQFFKSVFDIKLPSSIVEVRANDRRGARAVEFARKANEVAAKANWPVAQRQALACKVSEICAVQFPKEPRFSAMDVGLDQLVRQIYQDGNAVLLERYPHLRQIFETPRVPRGGKTACLDLDTGGPALRDAYYQVFQQAMRQILKEA
jgi:hypothetical protein